MPKLKLRQTSRSPDVPLLVSVAALLIFGLVMVYDASVVFAHDSFGGKYHFVILQGLWVGGGVLLAFFLSRLDYHHLLKISPWLLLACLLLLVLVLVPGVGVRRGGAQRWFDLRYFTVQPTELAKLGFVLFLAHRFAGDGRRKKPFGFLGFLALLVVLLVLVVVQPDLGTAVVLGTVGVWIYFLSGASFFHLGVSLAALAFSVGVLVLSSPYRKQRFLTFLNPAATDPLSAGYHIRQALIALGSGGLWGLGFGQSRQKFLYLPSVMTDSIFAVVGEELGFVGCASVVLLLAFFFYRGFLVAKKAPDKAGQLLAGGILGWLAIQVLVNLSAMTALVPLTGIPLPLVSYGGSSMLVNLAAVGILLNISGQRKGR